MGTIDDPLLAPSSSRRQPLACSQLSAIFKHTNSCVQFVQERITSFTLALRELRARVPSQARLLWYGD